MASPLDPYINGRFLADNLGTTSISGGRLTYSQPDKYLIKLFIKRAQYSGVSSGSRKIPLQSELGGEMMAGAKGDQFYYRGYALAFSTVPSNWNLSTSDESGLTFTNVTGQPQWLLPGSVGAFRFGNDPIVPEARIQRSSGVFGGQGIDEIVYDEIGGVQIQITGANLEF
jgi:hypothetical protein